MYILLDCLQFEDFSSFSEYIEGNLFTNACYFQLAEERIPEGIDKQRLLERKSFIENNVDDFTLMPSNQEQADYEAVEKNKRHIINWINKFISCTDGEQLKKMAHNYEKSVLHGAVDISFFFWNYIFADVNDEKRFHAIMEFVSSGNIPSYKIRDALCSIYDPDKVIDNYKYSLGSYKTNRKRIRELKEIAKTVKNGDLEYRRESFFDSATHFYCVATWAYKIGEKRSAFHYYEFFENIDAFVRRLAGDLSNCDLSNVRNNTYDFSKYTISDTTQLPINSQEKYEYLIWKGYRDGKFTVAQGWKNGNGCIVKHYIHSFDYFFDFVAFLKGDLSDADLISCDGLLNLISIDGIDLTKAKVTSDVCEKYNIPFECYSIDVPEEISFNLVKQNEKENALVPKSTQEISEVEDSDLSDSEEEWDYENVQICYISDMHLYHLIKNKRLQSKNDITKLIRDLVETIIDESERSSIVLINGDTSLDYNTFVEFSAQLRKIEKTIIFTIGNHDIWSRPNETIDQLAEKYRAFLQTNDMYLLHNDILYFEEFYQPPLRITEDEINRDTDEELRARVRKARLILFGGTGFSGYNQNFNAENGVYRYNNTIGYSRDVELSETKRFDALYNRICSVFYDKNVVIMSHMPLPDWHAPTTVSENADLVIGTNVDFGYGSVYATLQKGFIYLSGHTHRNCFYDDGDIRIYADNQFGYHDNDPSAWPHLKYFEVEDKVDYFSDYKDGVYEITADDYRSFNRCKYIMMDFNREVNILYMLKKNDHYCFIHRSKNGGLSILNGGALKGLDHKNIDFYYDNMDLVIALIKDPLDEYTELQKKISNDIKKIGGSGTIHGCIVDIDFYNHVYVNPVDGTITGYWASDIINKLVYPSVPELLEAQCPSLFAAYKKMLQGTEKNMPVLFRQEHKIAPVPIPYSDTDIYKVSRQIKKMQKLYSNILSTWPDRLPKRKTIEAGTKY